MYLFVKRAMDIVLTLPAVLIASPVLLVLIVAIRLSSKGPAVFKQERAGKNGKPFTIYKFRTMRLDADPYGPSPKSGRDPRLTGIGIFLREHSLDELPQLINVLKGDMTLVGPRPLYVSQMEEWNETQKRRLLVKPGLTGLAQVSGRGGLTREQKLALDVEYVDNACLSLDLRLIMATFKQVLGRQNIYEKRYSETEQTRNADNEE
ncbi:putative sugar transferase EpsL [Anaerohalosphaera lusitana]|uniref:Putative sugar transferase EpsL n=1 Tax=Anaerohalosphaera lusitana TaxID=1936003 RepID=A0A1U9NQZ1_9BACT|nr:sugar transferase [Anaerohalosphaera lusitana]AQT70329.1 putative sugar transferase EpsL [Anaerohalosphaera lusitana]